MKFSKEVLLEVVRKAVENAGQLVEEAKLLKEHNRFARAFTLYQLSIEEIGKASMTFGFLLFGDIEDGAEQKAFLKEFRDHKTKTKRATGVDLNIARTINNRELSKTLISNVVKQHEEVDKINDYKNYSLYTSFIDGAVYLPSEFISEQLVEDLGFYAEIRFEASRQYYEASIRDFDELVKVKATMDFDKILRDDEEFMKDIMGE